MPAQHPFKPGDKVQCVDAPIDPYSKLDRGFTYTVAETRFRPNDLEPMVKLVGHPENQTWRASRFRLVGRALSPSLADRFSAVAVGALEEEQLRAILTTSSDPYVCPKCGAPKSACTYHS